MEATATSLNTHEARLADVEDKLYHFSCSGNEISITGANMRLVNDMGSTGTTNSLGNQFIRYNELRGMNIASISGGYGNGARWKQSDLK